MALLKKFRNCSARHKFSPIFMQCFQDALHSTLIRTGQFSFIAYNKLPVNTFCSYSATWKKLTLNEEVRGRLRLESVPKVIQRRYATEEKAPDAFSRFSTGIDFNALRDARIKEMKLSGKDVNIHQIIKDIVKEKCDEAFANLNAEDQRKLKIVQLEHDVLYSQGYNIIPAEEMTSENWLDAIEMKPNQRRRFFFFLQNLMSVKRKEKERKALKSRLQEETSSQHPPRSPINDNKLFLRLYGSTVKRWQNHRLASSMRFGLPLLWDMDYADFMNSQEIKNTANQLLDVYRLNRLDKRIPFHLHFTSCAEDHPVFNYLQMYILNDPHFMATVTPQSCVDLFDKKDLIYLSPHAHQVMTEFDPNAVYVIGVFNDRSFQRPISYARAKELGVKCLQLPLDKYVHWKLGSKALTLNQMMMIFQAIKNDMPWADALKAIPTRKIDRPKSVDDE